MSDGFPSAKWHITVSWYFVIYLKKTQITFFKPKKLIWVFVEKKPSTVLFFFAWGIQLFKLPLPFLPPREKKNLQNKIRTFFSFSFLPLSVTEKNGLFHSMRFGKKKKNG